MEGSVSSDKGIKYDDGKVKKQPPDLTAGEFNRSE